MNHVEHEIAIWGGYGRLRLGTIVNREGETEEAVEYAYRDVNGEFSRGTVHAMPVTAFAALAAFASYQGFVGARDLVAAIDRDPQLIREEASLLSSLA